jgi:AcrR family transcriptional regulator
MKKSRENFRGKPRPSAIARAQSGKTVWRRAIRDAVDGVSMDKIAEATDLARSSVFHMRRKIPSLM